MKIASYLKVWLSGLLILFTFLSVNSQILSPVSWNFKVEALGNGEANLILEADIDENWHLYTLDIIEGDGPIPTEINFDENNGIKFLGNIEESESLTDFDEVWDMDISYFADQAIFTQRVKNMVSTELTITGNVFFMTCDNKQCLAPEEVPFSFVIPAGSKIEINSLPIDISVSDVNSDEEETGILDPVSWTFKVEKTEGDNYNLIISAEIEEKWHVYATELESDEGPVATEITVDDNDDIELIGKLKSSGQIHTEYDPNFMMDLSYYSNRVEFVQEFSLKTEGTKVKGNVFFMTCDDEKCLPPEQVDFEIIVGNVSDVAPAPQDESAEAKVGVGISFWSTFIKGFFGGFLALLTPCVFPMIPLTVSFFTKQSKTKAKGISNAILYGLSIIGIYVLLGYGVTAIFGADALNALSTNVYFNLAFFVLLTVFAISFFGAFEITIPSSWVNKADSASDKGGLLGIFFMAFTLSLVSFSCTGPIIGTLLVDAAVNGGVAGPLIGMFGFSLALALPFALFAAFPGWLNSLPSSGGWLNTVKVVLGFLELAFAVKFLSNADLVVQAGLLKRELFIAIWIAIFGLMTAYLLGFFSLPHDSKSDRISVTKLLFAIPTLIFTIYLIPGLWGAPLKAISGFPPPMFYSESPHGIGGIRAAPMIITGEDGDVIGDPEHCPHSLNCFHDYDEGMAYAKEIGKPVMLDFTGWACVNCRKMEEQVWSDPSVLKLLREDFVLISLYVDEKIELPKSEQIEVKIGKKTKMLKTVGNKWSYFQALRYNTNSQPFYVILDQNENMLNGSAAYDPDVEKYRNWLQEGKERYYSN